MEQADKTVANFIQKTFEILQDPSNGPIIEWNAAGTEFSIKEIEQFEQEILPKYFRHRNINSFIRQLNMYGFHKSRKDPSKNIFSHPNFLRTAESRLILVKRKIKGEELAEENTPYKPVLDKKPFYPRKEVALSEPKIPLREKNLNKYTESKCPGSNPQIPHYQSTQEVHNAQEAIGPAVPNEREYPTPLKSLIQRSNIFDNDLYFRTSNEKISADWNEIELLPYEDDKVSIADAIEEDQKVSDNRMSGITILHTHNFLNDMDF